MPSVTTPVIAAEARPDSAFTVPLPEVDPPLERLLADAATEPEAEASLHEEEQAQEPQNSAPAALIREADRLQAEASRLAAEAAELRLARERERLAAEQGAAEARRAQERLTQQQAEQQARQQLEKRATEELLARERLAAQQGEQQLAQQARVEQEPARLRAENERQLSTNEAAAQRRREQEALARHAEQRRVEETAAREAQLLERQHLEEFQRRIAEQLAQREREEALRLAQEQGERERLEELARRRLAEERARRDADERAEAERLAQQRAREAARQAAVAPARSDAALPGPDGQGGPGPAIGQGAGPGAGPGTGAGPRRPAAGALAGGVGSRARELLRGVTIPSVEPPARVHQQADPRRVVAGGAERDAPLRLYVDSVRQKLERNAVLGGARFASREVRIDPLVSLSLRSDGSIDEVTIVRSSGRPDMDDAVRRFVRLNARYSAFPPNVAARFDVIEIRRVWAFADGLKLMEELR
ncbi:energy transducer TonB [Telluria aromaticivorans]|uniref:TonB C-terminal domain-containing protein n=1 Tax=Telluria aromaticivorans TaxID=2725995 RepID=A0A7Y2JZ27_9BURK|nr:energy transducer TonB [Telluria aromaticivorans]NNG23393.1 hypothetical protein [Telluria aromaticivorans]